MIIFLWHNQTKIINHPVFYVKIRFTIHYMQNTLHSTALPATLHLKQHIFLMPTWMPTDFPVCQKIPKIMPSSFITLNYVWEWVFDLRNMKKYHWIRQQTRDDSRFQIMRLLCILFMMARVRKDDNYGEWYWFKPIDHHKGSARRKISQNIEKPC